MKKISFLFVFILFGCSENELRDNFRKVIIDYQKTYPVKNPKKGRIYIHSIYFFKNNNDTLFTITRGGTGITDFIAKNDYTFGVYSDEELKDLVITDSFKLSSKLIVNYKRNFPDSLIWRSQSFPENITPLATYKLKNGIPLRIKTDTIWNHWD